MLKRGKYISSSGLATWLINNIDRSSGDEITHLKLQKLIYYCDAWYLANFDRPSIRDDFEAWAHGPVVKAVYNKYSGNSFEPLAQEERVVEIPKGLVRFLTAVLEEYGQYSGKKLEKLTHEEDPWRDAREGLRPEARSNKKIEKIKIRNFYAGRLGKEPIKSFRIESGISAKTVSVDAESVALQDDKISVTCATMSTSTSAFLSGLEMS